ncbi:hypothetical protein ACU4GR_12455 [Methylobacterium oryzae CBMB20]
MAGLPFSRVSRSRLAAPSSIRATSPSRSDGPVRVRAQDDVAELLRGAQAPLRLDAELELLLVGDRAGADPTHGRLHSSAPGSPR